MINNNNPQILHENEETDKFLVEILKKMVKEQNDPQSYYLLGLRYLDGKGVPQNSCEGFRLLQKAADMGFKDACHELGVCYYYGEGTEQDFNAAARWWAEAAASGNLDSMSNLGLYYTRHNNKKLNEKGIKLLKTAAEQGQPEAQCNLGVAYWQGQGIKKDVEKGLKWLEKAAEQKLPNALFGLGLYYKEKLDEQKKNNENFVESADKAAKYMYAAADAGFPPAIEFINEAEKQLEEYLKSDTKEDQTK